MSVTAEQYLPVAHVETRTEPIPAEVVPEDGSMLPIPAHEPIGSFAAFLLAGPGSVALAVLSCVALVSVGGGASLTLWSTGMGVLFTVWALGLVAALWASNARHEWGRA